MQVISITALLLVVTPALASKPDKELVRRAPKKTKSGLHEVEMDGSGKLQKAHKAEDAKKAHPAKVEAIKEESHHHKKKPEAVADKFTFEDEDENDVALDELEAMTIESAMLKKHPIPRRRRQNCKWTEWELDGRCSQTCGGGMQPRKRKQSPGAAHGGTPCPGKDNEIMKPCDNDACPTTPAPTPAPTTTTAAAVRISDVSLCMFLVAWGALGLNIQ